MDIHTEYNKKMIRDFLENCYTGAKMQHDEELKIRVARALFAFDYSVEEDLFLPDAEEKKIAEECAAVREKLERIQREKEEDEWDKLRKAYGNISITTSD